MAVYSEPDERPAVASDVKGATATDAGAGTQVEPIELRNSDGRKVLIYSGRELARQAEQQRTAGDEASRGNPLR